MPPLTIVRCRLLVSCWSAAAAVFDIFIPIWRDVFAKKPERLQNKMSGGRRKGFHQILTNDPPAVDVVRDDYVEERLDNNNECFFRWEKSPQNFVIIKGTILQSGTLITTNLINLIKFNYFIKSTNVPIYFKN